jgi:predicted nucleotidyltransferase
MGTPHRPVPDDWGRTHAALRGALLRRTAATLEADERFVAAWLAGSFGRGAADDLSDLDLTAVVAPAAAGALCARPWRSAGRTTPERRSLIEQLGRPVVPVVVHDAHVNAPSEGTHTNVAFDDGTHLDLTLVPGDGALRPPETRLLFQRVPVPLQPAPPPETLLERRERVAQRMALFWIMAMSTAKYRRRGWDSSVQATLVALREHLETVRRLLAGESPRFRRYAPSVPLAATPEAQGAAVRALCDEMEALLPALTGLGIDLPPAPRAQIERWLGRPR